MISYQKTEIQRQVESKLEEIEIFFQLTQNFSINFDRHLEAIFKAVDDLMGGDQEFDEFEDHQTQIFAKQSFGKESDDRTRDQTLMLSETRVSCPTWSLQNPFSNLSIKSLPSVACQYPIPAPKSPAEPFSLLNRDQQMENSPFTEEELFLKLKEQNKEVHDMMVTGKENFQFLKEVFLKMFSMLSDPSQPHFNSDRKTKYKEKRKSLQQRIDNLLRESVQIKALASSKDERITELELIISKMNTQQHIEREKAFERETLIAKYENELTKKDLQIDELTYISTNAQMNLNLSQSSVIKLEKKLGNLKQDFHSQQDQFLHILSSKQYIEAFPLSKVHSDNINDLPSQIIDKAQQIPKRGSIPSGFYPFDPQNADEDYLTIEDGVRGSTFNSTKDRQKPEPKEEPSIINRNYSFSQNCDNSISNDFPQQQETGFTQNLDLFHSISSANDSDIKDQSPQVQNLFYNRESTGIDALEIFQKKSGIIAASSSDQEALPSHGANGLPTKSDPFVNKNKSLLIDHNTDTENALADDKHNESSYSLVQLNSNENSLKFFDHYEEEVPERADSFIQENEREKKEDFSNS